MPEGYNTVCWHCNTAVPAVPITIYVGHKDDPVSICNECAREEGRL